MITIKDGLLQKEILFKDKEVIITPGIFLEKDWLSYKIYYDFLTDDRIISRILDYDFDKIKESIEDAEKLVLTNIFFLDAKLTMYFNDDVYNEKYKEIAEDYDHIEKEKLFQYKHIDDYRNDTEGKLFALVLIEKEDIKLLKEWKEKHGIKKYR